MQLSLNVIILVHSLNMIHARMTKNCNYGRKYWEDTQYDRRLEANEIAKVVSTSEERTRQILHEEFSMRKLCTLLDQMRNQLPQHYLCRFKKNPNDFMCCFVTIDKTWFHYITPEPKQTKQWIEADGSAPKKVKKIASYFMYLNLVLLINCLPKGRTING